MSQARFIIGDTRDVVATIPDGSVDLVMTSPPFLALRSYLPADHPDKHREIGSEPTPADFLDTLLTLTAEWRRVLAPHGSIAVELGHTYSSLGGTTDNRETTLCQRDQVARQRGGGDGWPLAKSLALIPELYRIALAYGINPLTGAESPAGRWRVRNVVRWVRPNPPVGALGDKFRPATSDLVIACTSAKRWFDLDAVRTPHKNPDDDRSSRASVKTATRDDRLGAVLSNGGNSAGAPPLDWWNIPPGGYPGSHYAVYPPELCVIPIKSMCPAEVCRACGEPRRRIVDAQRCGETDDSTRAKTGGPLARSQDRPPEVGWEYERTTVGWTDCGCNAGFRPGLVLDPFGGSGTTGIVATGHGRDAILVDLDERNADLARERIGMFLTVEHHRDATS